MPKISNPNFSSVTAMRGRLARIEQSLREDTTLTGWMRPNYEVAAKKLRRKIKAWVG